MPEPDILLEAERALGRQEGAVVYGRPSHPLTTGTAATCSQASTAPGQAPNVQAHDPWALPSAGTRLDA